MIDEVRQEESSLRGEMIILLQRLRFEDGVEEFRLGYYIIGKKPRVQGKWVWEQFALMMPPEDFAALIEKARAKGWV